MGEASVSGVLPRDLGNAVSDAFFAATERGMEPDEAVCVVIGVAVDYARSYYGDDYAKQLSGLILKMCAHPPRETDINANRTPTGEQG